MNRFLKLVLPGVAAIAIVGTPILASYAQSPAPGVEAPKKRAGKRLQLTDQQKQAMKQIRDQSMNKIRGILDAEQQKVFDQARQNKTNKRQAWRSLNLREDQKKQVREIMAESRKQIFDTVLTEEQRTQMQQMRQTRQGRPARS